MTNEEAIARIREHMIIHKNKEPRAIYITEALEMAIKALEQIELNTSYNGVKTELEPCGDCISRTELLSRIDAERKHLLEIKMDGAEHIIVHHARRIIEDMPSVTPKSEYSWKEIKIKFECDDCISREAVFKIFDEACYIDGDWYVMREKIEKLPSVTQTRPKGKWKILDECANEGVYCSKCHKTVFKLEFSHTMKWRNFKYCPNCGAKMEAENEKETC